MHALASSLTASPAEAVRGLLDSVRAAFAEHRSMTEGSHGLYAGLIDDAPRLARAVSGLVVEHTVIDSTMARLITLADDEELRRGALEILDDLHRHRQTDADLVYEAYTTDIGGE